MKNITFNVAPMGYTQVPQSIQQQTFTPTERYMVSFSVQFDDADKALMFAKTMLSDLQDYER